MKITMKQIGMAVLAISFFLIQGSSDENLALKTDQDRANYATGVKIVRKLKQQGGEVNLDIVIQGMKDGLTDYRLLMSEDEISAAANVRRAQRIPKQKESGIAQIRQTGASNTGVPAASGQTTTVEAGNKDPAGDTARDKNVDQVVQNSGFNPAIQGTSLVERGRTRNEIKRRGLEQRQKTMAQERGGG